MVLQTLTWLCGLVISWFTGEHDETLLVNRTATPVSQEDMFATHGSDVDLRILWEDDDGEDGLDEEPLSYAQNNNQ
jgi:hypothetical protein